MGHLVTVRLSRFGTSFTASRPTLRYCDRSHSLVAAQIRAMMPCQPTPNDIPREIIVVLRAPIVVQDGECCSCCRRWEDRIACGRHRPPASASRIGTCPAKLPRRESPPVQPQRSADDGACGSSAAAPQLQLHPSPMDRATEVRARRSAAPPRSVTASHACKTNEIREHIFTGQGACKATEPLH